MSNQYELDELNKKLLEIIQDDFPLTKEPFTEIGARVGLTAEETLACLTKLKEKGILRHFGASIDSRKLGFVTTLCALSVPEDKEEVIAQQIAKRPEVTHCYLRKHKFNIWFTLVAKDWPIVEKILEGIAQETGFSPRHFPAKKMFKLKAVFRLAKK
ncbi:putative transcriptional regulator, AsnC family [Thermodesulfatator indicus DSM 15286]|uniref:siroheme decarboxylase n=1 Tax=Thermodesulfatator indicus (strain DSM 15286 / JCM 11887 / CIR29812) TaxID=667014 RepID=F8A907_THEID|nr:AsnC family transcriptional regulator [Thermodesulfatator indicus]AEH44057.1 putative transcriptional regulator, AsnC family [Thermodesulfatator indicus DSM 15286]